MKITDVEAIVVELPNLDLAAADAQQDALIVKVTTDEGIVGWGEGNHTPRAMKAIIDSPGSHSWSQGIKDMLIGRDPLQPERIWDLMFRGTVMSGRRGMVPAVLAAIDVALWDIKGKAESKPIYELLGGASGKPVVPYTSLYPGPLPYEESKQWLVDKLLQSRELGFNAYKIEPLADCVPHHHQVLEVASAVHHAVGDTMAMLVDVGHRWETAKVALRWLAELEQFNPQMIETPLWLEDVDGYRKVADRSPIPVSVGELFVTRNEFTEMMDRGGVDIVQPCVARVGFTESRRVAEDALARGRQIVPFGFVATTLAVAANIQLLATLTNAPWMEFCHLEVYPDQELRRNLFGPEPEMVDGAFVLPTGPGLGVEIDESALEHYRVA